MRTACPGAVLTLTRQLLSTSRLGLFMSRWMTGGLRVWR